MALKSTTIVLAGDYNEYTSYVKEFPPQERRGFIFANTVYDVKVGASGKNANGIVIGSFRERPDADIVYAAAKEHCKDILES